jgi:hypothetical protein
MTQVYCVTPLVMALCAVLHSGMAIDAIDKQFDTPGHYNLPTPHNCPACNCVVDKKYFPSETELSWMHSINTLSLFHKNEKELVAWKHGCIKMKSMSMEVKVWLDYCKERESWSSIGDKGTARSAAIAFNTSVMSYFDITEECVCDKKNPQTHTTRQRIPIEPLMGSLRHPWFPCWNRNEATVFNKDYMISQYSHEMFPTVLRTPGCSRKYFFDLGASMYRIGIWGASESWFVETFEAQGISFDRILAWEGIPYKASELFADYPAGVFEKVSYYNVLAVTDPLAAANPLRVLKSIAGKEDLVVFKLDIDNAVVEAAFVDQIMKDVELINLIDEFYFEHHFTFHPLTTRWAGTTQHNITQSYELFSTLRHQGVRAHSWV